MKKHGGGILRGYVWWCAILLSLYSCSSLVVASSTLILRGIQESIVACGIRISSTPSVEEDSVRSSMAQVTSEHRQLMAHVAQWLRTRDDETINDFIQFMDGKRKSAFVRRVEWSVDWLLGLYKVVAPFAVLSLFSAWRQGVEPQDSMHVRDDEEEEEEEEEIASCANSTAVYDAGCWGEQGQDRGADENPLKDCLIVKSTDADDGGLYSFEGKVSTPTLGSEPMPQMCAR